MIEDIPPEELAKLPTRLRYNNDPLPNSFGLAHSLVFLLYPAPLRKHKMPSDQDILLEQKLWARKEEHKAWNDKVRQALYKRIILREHRSASQS